jgi:hypothetical protein
LSKEYIYAGSRLLAVEDANAQAAPPADIAVWRPVNGSWYVMGQTGSQATSMQFGATGDFPAPGDYDADGKTDFAVFRPSDGTWWVFQSAYNSYYAMQFGGSSDKPAAADYDGDGKTDFAVFRIESNGSASWYIWSSANNNYSAVTFGAGGDIPAAADYTGDGRADIAVYRPSDGSYHMLDLTNSAWTYFSTGVAGLGCAADPLACVVPSDYDGDGRADAAVFNASNASWTIRASTTGIVASATWGTSGSSGCTGGTCPSGLRPVHNDYDLDGKTDLAVWDNASSATWKIRRSSDLSTRTETWGSTGDIPVPAFYRR